MVKYRNTIRDEMKIPREAKVFGSITPIVTDKGVNEMISAFVRLAEEYRDVYLLIIGHTTEKNSVTAATMNHIRNHERIRNIGWVKGTGKLSCGNGHICSAHIPRRFRHSEY